MAIIENLDKKYIFLHRDFGNKEEVFHFINGILLEDGYVTEEYLPKVLERENTFPTGMELEKIKRYTENIEELDNNFEKERIARNRLQMLKPGEVIYRLNQSKQEEK